MDMYMQPETARLLSNGRLLREAHRVIGYHVGAQIARDEKIDIVIGLLRSGAFFAEGTADQADCTLLFLNPSDEILSKKNIKEIRGKTVVLADGVINTGEEIRKVRAVIRIFGCTCDPGRLYCAKRGI